MTPEQLLAISEAREACVRLAEAEDEIESAREFRRQAWARCSDAGVTQEALADDCGVSKALVKAEIARTRGRTWMNR